MGAFEHSLSIAYAQREEDSATLSVCMVDSGVHLSDVPALSQRMRETYPDVSLMFHYAPMSKWHLALEDGLCDMAVTVEFDAAGMSSRFVLTEILSVPKLACVLRSNPLSRLDHITYDDLRNQRFISNSENPKYAAFIRRICLAHGFEPTFGDASINAHGLTSMLQHNDEVLICDRFLRGLNSPLFKLFELPNTYSGLYTVHLRESKNPYIQPFIQTMQDYYNPEQN